MRSWIEAMSHETFRTIFEVWHTRARTIVDARSHCAAWATQLERGADRPKLMLCDAPAL